MTDDRLRFTLFVAIPNDDETFDLRRVGELRLVYEDAAELVPEYRFISAAELARLG